MGASGPGWHKVEVMGVGTADATAPLGGGKRRKAHVLMFRSEPLTWSRLNRQQRRVAKQFPAACAHPPYAQPHRPPSPSSPQKNPSPYCNKHDFNWVRDNTWTSTHRFTPFAPWQGGDLLSWSACPNPPSNPSVPHNIAPEASRNLPKTPQHPPIPHSTGSTSTG